jgi:hypothetical protein
MVTAANECVGNVLMLSEGGMGARNLYSLREGKDIVSLLWNGSTAVDCLTILCRGFEIVLGQGKLRKGRNSGQARWCEGRAWDETSME